MNEKYFSGYTFRHVPYDGQTYFQAATETELQKLFLNRCEQIVPGQVCMLVPPFPDANHGEKILKSGTTHPYVHGWSRSYE